MPFYLYDLKLHGRTVYVGLTLNPHVREQQHRTRRRDKRLRLRVVAEFPDMFSAIAAENARIAEKSPRMNTLMRRDKKRPKNGPHKRWDKAKAEQMLRDGVPNGDVAVAVGVEPHTLWVNFPLYMRHDWMMQKYDERNPEIAAEWARLCATKD